MAARRGAAQLLLGLALLAGLVLVVSRRAEVEEFVRLAEQAQPRWLLLAAVLQAGTYLAQGAVWLLISRAAGGPLTLWDATRLTIAKLFVDQSLPSVGISGTLLVSEALERRGLARPASAAAAVGYTASNQLAFALSVAVAVVLAGMRGESIRALLLATMLALGCGMLMAGSALLLAGRAGGRIRGALTRIPPLRPVLRTLAEADPRLAHRGDLLWTATVYQALNILLDAATLWVVFAALGLRPPFAAVFTSLALSNVFRMVGVLPGGLGTFEAASVVALRLAGIQLSAALSAVLLFRLLSFWLPMLPGWWLARGALRPRERIDQHEGGPGTGAPLPGGEAHKVEG